MKYAAQYLLIIIFFLFSGPVMAATSPLPDPTKTTIMWNKNPEPSVIKYIISWGTKPRVYTKSRTIARNYYNFSKLVIGGKTYYFVVEAVDINGLISKRSVELANTFPIKP